jgi:hypothetical protein
MSLDKEIDRIKSEFANIGSKMITGKTIEELIKDIIREVK